MTAGLALGLTATGAARFSFLLSIPVIVLAGGARTVQLIQQAGPVDWVALGLGAGLAALTLATPGVGWGVRALWLAASGTVLVASHVGHVH